MEQCSETSAYKIQTPGNYSAYKIQNTAKVWNQERCNTSFCICRRHGDRTPGIYWALHLEATLSRRCHSQNIFSGCRHPSYFDMLLSPSSPWRRRLQFPLKCPQICSRRQRHTSKKTALSLTTAMRTPNTVNSVTFQAHPMWQLSPHTPTVGIAPPILNFDSKWTTSFTHRPFHSVARAPFPRERTE